jgi:hypothetical protein
MLFKVHFITGHPRPRGIALLILNLSARRRWVVSTMPQLLYPPEKDPVLIVLEAGWTPGPVWTCAKNLAPTGIQFPDRPVCSSVAILTELPGPHGYVIWLPDIENGRCISLLKS